MIARSPEPQPFEEYSALFRSIAEGYTDGAVEVYAPIIWGTRSDRRRIRDSLREPIRVLIERLVKETIQQNPTTEGIGSQGQTALGTAKPAEAKEEIPNRQ